MTREVVAQQPPKVPVDQFPCRTVRPDDELHRAHTASYGPWWFGNDGGGRFDLYDPRGTCYLADSALTAVRERLGVVLGGSPTAPASLLDGVVVSRLHLPERCACADLQSRRAVRYAVTRELETMVPYDVPQAWAHAFDAAGFGAVAYGPRFSTGTATSYAVFGPAGSASWPVDASPVPARAVPGVPVVVDPPRRWDLTVVRPPRTRTR